MFDWRPLKEVERQYKVGQRYTVGAAGGHPDLQHLVTLVRSQIARNFTPFPPPALHLVSSFLPRECLQIRVQP